jgi:hypothetical protein
VSPPPFLHFGHIDIELRAISGLLLMAIATVAAVQAMFPWWAPVLTILVVATIELTLRRGT